MAMSCHFHFPTNRHSLRSPHCSPVAAFGPSNTSLAAHVFQVIGLCIATTPVLLRSSQRSRAHQPLIFLLRELAPGLLGAALGLLPRRGLNPAHAVEHLFLLRHPQRWAGAAGACGGLGRRSTATACCSTLKAIKEGQGDLSLLGGIHLDEFDVGDVRHLSGLPGRAFPSRLSLADHGIRATHGEAAEVVQALSTFLIALHVIHEIFDGILSLVVSRGLEHIPRLLGTSLGFLEVAVAHVSTRLKHQRARLAHGVSQGTEGRLCVLRRFQGILEVAVHQIRIGQNVKRNGCLLFLSQLLVQLNGFLRRLQGLLRVAQPHRGQCEVHVRHQLC
mmetsp:Transcript_76529/g.155332  ORF Transcript_76529/g.155332 Transcript_76529/m.155332 type:complete len:332 (+) Transcript_76529:22-1017(+)